jgi:orotidine-5'-phosphate decarboxylase
MGLDPDPAKLGEAAAKDGSDDPAASAGAAIAASCRRLIEQAGHSCVAVKPQLACFERLGGAGWMALAETVRAAREAGLLVIADAKRGDVPHTTTAYAQGLLGITETPWGEVPGVSADAATVNPLTGSDALDAWVEVAQGAGAGLFSLVRTSNAGAADVLDLVADGAPVFEHLARLVAERAPRLTGKCGLSGMGAVVGATQPEHLARLRELMPRSIFLLPGVGAQGGSAQDLAAAFAAHPASAIVTASRSIVDAPDPSLAAEELRAEVWDLRAA